MRRPWITLPVLLACVAPACSSPSPAPPNPLKPRPVRTVSVWDLDRSGETLGVLRLIEIDDPEGLVEFYRVETEYGQFVGNIDSQGRVYRSVPFETREEFLGMYPMDQGLALLFEIDGGIRMTKRDVDAAEASSPR